MPLRLVVACAAAVSLCCLALAVACGGGQRARPISAATPGDGGARDGARDAVVPPLFGGACPEDAPWTGAVCLGQGYVACPGGYSMDDRSRCVRDVAPATVVTASSPVEAGGKDDDESD